MTSTTATGANAANESSVQSSVPSTADTGSDEALSVDEQFERDKEKYTSYAEYKNVIAFRNYKMPNGKMIYDVREIDPDKPEPTGYEEYELVEEYYEINMQVYYFKDINGYHTNDYYWKTICGTNLSSPKITVAQAEQDTTGNIYVSGLNKSPETISDETIQEIGRTGGGLDLANKKEPYSNLTIGEIVYDKIESSEEFITYEQIDGEIIPQQFLRTVYLSSEYPGCHIWRKLKVDLRDGSIISDDVSA